MMSKKYAPNHLKKLPDDIDSPTIIEKSMLNCSQCTIYSTYMGSDDFDLRTHYFINTRILNILNVLGSSTERTMCIERTRRCRRLLMINICDD